MASSLSCLDDSVVRNLESVKKCFLFSGFFFLLADLGEKKSHVQGISSRYVQCGDSDATRV